MQKLILSLLCVVTGITLSAQELTMRISGIRQGKGDIFIAVFNSEEGFPNNIKKAVKFLRASPVDGKAELVVKTLTPGRYAIAMFQDTNNDGILNTNFLGIPKEGYGVSNNAFNTFSSPTYKDASFSYPETTSLVMQLKY